MSDSEVGGLTNKQIKIKLFDAMIIIIIRRRIAFNTASFMNTCYQNMSHRN